MPSRHRRIGLVVDEEVHAALAVVREHSRQSAPGDATVAREAVFEGAVLAALMSAATRTGSPESDRASALLGEVRALLASLALPDGVVGVVAGSLEAATGDQAATARRRRQLALLEAPNPYGRATLDLADSFDAMEAAG